MDSDISKCKFVKCYLNLCYLFDASEMLFIHHMIDIEFLRQNNYNTTWSRDFICKKMGLGVRIFDRCVKKFTAMNLLIRSQAGCKFTYHWNMKCYERLVYMLSVTNDVQELKKFCNNKFVQGKRSIESITDQEIELLQDSAPAYKKDINPLLKGTWIMGDPGKPDTLTGDTSDLEKILNSNSDKLDLILSLLQNATPTMTK